MAAPGGAGASYVIYASPRCVTVACRDCPYSEEAERLWRRREADWAREERARRRLMEDVVAGWREQSERRLQRCRADRQREAELREAAAAQAEQQRRFVQETEELRQQRQAELRDSWARQVRGYSNRGVATDF